MANQENKRLQGLPHGKRFSAILLASIPPVRAIGKIYLVPPESYDYDGIFELVDRRLLEHMAEYGTEIGVEDLGTQKVKVVGECASDTDPHIYFQWADKAE